MVVVIVFPSPFGFLGSDEIRRSPNERRNLGLRGLLVRFNASLM